MNSKITSRIAGTLFIYASVFGFHDAIASPGHEHGHANAATSTAPASPRVTAISENYEFVGILKNGRLTVYLDRLIDTSPVTDARIELTVDGETGLAEPQANGTYLFKAPTLLKHGNKEVIISIADGAKSDLLVGTLKDAFAEHRHVETDKFGHNHALHHPEAIATNVQDEPRKDQHDASPRQDAHEHSHVGGDFSVFVAMLPKPWLLAFLGLVIGILIGKFARRRAGILASLTFLVALIGAGAAWAGPGHDHATVAPVDGANGDRPRRMSNGSLFVPKPTQRLLEIRTQVLQNTTMRKSQQLIGRVISDPNRSGLVQSTIGGRMTPPEGGLPVLGRVVKAGQVLAFVEPAFAPIDASDVRQTGGELDQQIALVEARIKRKRQLVERQVARFADLQDLEIQLRGLEARKKQLAESRSKPEVLTAPVDGIIAEVRVVAGQVVASSDTLFRVIDPKSLWVEAIAFDPRLLPGLGTARARTVDGEPLGLTFVGRSRTLRQQSTILHFSIENPSNRLSIGSPVKVLIETGEPITGLIVPRRAISQAPNGQLVAFKRLEPERYQPTPVRIEDIDGELVHIVAGLDAGDQIIVRNAPILSQIR